jgi:urate oxidase
MGMTLVRNTYGKGRVRVMRVHRVGEKQEARELTVKTMLEGAFEACYTKADNSAAIATDTIKNIVHIVARENMAAGTEDYCKALAERFLTRYPQVERAIVTAHETKWVRLAVGGAAHPHSFLLDSNGKPFATLTATRGGMTMQSGIDGFTFMKSTASGWENYVHDEYTTLPETNDRMCATAMDARWTWAKAPADYANANALILQTALDVFAGTYSASVQDSLYRMGEAALKAVPEISDIGMACPNKHYILANLAPFGLDNANQVFIPTDEPHGQIECVVGRS